MKKDLKTHMDGFTVFEMMIGIAIVTIFASIAAPNYIKFREKARVELAITEMRFIEKEIMNYLIDNGELPEDLSAIGMDDMLDPWGRPYNYLRISESDESEEDEAQDNNGKPRKDHSLHPINTDYDLFSVGKDSKSTAPLTAKITQDDIVRANNGGYVGLVSNY
jgi:general secretion pathway protein G